MLKYVNTYPIAFAGAPLDRADPIRRDPALVEAALSDPRARFLLLDGLDPVMTDDGCDIAWVTRAAIGDAATVLLGVDEEGRPYFAASLNGAASQSSGQAVAARQVVAQLGASPITGLVAQARSILDWHRRHGFCANCGHKTEVTKAGYCRSCPSCSSQHFPRVDPVVIMLAIHEGKALIGRQPEFPPQLYSALAGFVEPGETLEEAVARELHEEAGVVASNIRYFASQPWPFPSNLMVGAFCDAQDFDIRLDRDELEDARWITRDDWAAALDGQTEWNPPAPYSIAYLLLKQWASAAR